MDFFFALSGFVIGYAYDDRWATMSTRQFFVARLIRLHPLVVAGAVLGVREPSPPAAMAAGVATLVVMVVFAGVILRCFDEPVHARLRKHWLARKR